MNQIKQNEPCRRDRHGYCWTCQADALDRCPARVSRRGFISMLGSGLLVAAAPEVITMGWRTGMSPGYERHLSDPSEWFLNEDNIELVARQYTEALLRSLAATRFEVEKRVWARIIPVSAIYGDSKGEDHGSSSET